MTGKHCNHCGDPIFRYDGQEFCPTCQQEAQGGAAQQGGTQQGTNQQGGTQQGTNQQGGAQSQPTPDSADQSVPETDDDEADRDDSADDEPRVEINDVRVADQHADRSNLRRPPSQQDDRERDGRHTHRHADSSRTGTGDQRATDRRTTDQNRRERVRDHARANGDTHSHDVSARDVATRDVSTRDVSARDAGDLGAAREALVRKLTDLSRKAEETDDVARARDLLAATREAAEALAALDRANR